MSRWSKPRPKSPQMNLHIASPYDRDFNRAKHAMTDTSVAAGTSIGAIVKDALHQVEARGKDFRRRGVELAITVRGEVIEYLRDTPAGATADEIAYELKHTPFTVRPRCTELHRMGLAMDSGRRGVNTSGKHAIIWILTPRARAELLFPNSPSLQGRGRGLGKEEEDDAK